MFHFAMQQHRSIMALLSYCPLFLFCVLTSGCHLWNQNSARIDYKTVSESPLRDSETAIRKHNRALHFLDRGNSEVAEQWIQQALMADVSYGPAHNTLGKIYYDQRKYYLAAWEFEYSADTMPDRAEPHNNLGLVFEATKRLDEAIFEYQTAHDMEPDNHCYLGNLLRAKIRSGVEAETLREDFKRLLFIEQRPSWQEWCGKILATLDEPTGIPTAPSEGGLSPLIEPLPNPDE